MRMQAEESSASTVILRARTLRATPSERSERARVE